MVAQTMVRQLISVVNTPIWSVRCRPLLNRLFHSLRPASGVTISADFIALPRLSSIIERLPREELHQHRRQNVWVYIVRLTFQGADLRIGDRFAECLSCVIHECVTCSAIHDECRCGYDGCPFGGD